MGLRLCEHTLHLPSAVLKIILFLLNKHGTVWMHMIHSHICSPELKTKKQKNIQLKDTNITFVMNVSFLKIRVETKLFKSSSNEQPMWDFSALLNGTWENTNHIKLLQN